MDYVSKRTCILPQIEYLDRLYQDSPDAMWLLPFRNTSDWLRSVTKWGNQKLGSLAMRFASACGWKEFNIDNKNRDNEVIQFICNHVRNVREFVMDHPSLSLIEFDIYDEKTGEHLAKSIPILNASNWGQQNKNDKIIG